MSELFGVGLSSGFAAAQADADGYLQAKFAKSNAASDQKKPRASRAKAAKPRAVEAAASGPGDAGPAPLSMSPQAVAELDDDERELLGLPPAAAAGAHFEAPAGDMSSRLETDRPLSGPSAGPEAAAAARLGDGAAASSAPEASSRHEPVIQLASECAGDSVPSPGAGGEVVEELVLEPPPDDCQERRPEPPEETLQDGSKAATRLAALGAVLRTSRRCPDGHPLVCYAVAWSCALCDECDGMQRPGEAVFGCEQCDSELCAKCVLESAPTAEAAEAERELIARVSAKKALAAGADARFVATPGGAVLDVAPAVGEALDASRRPGPCPPGSLALEALALTCPVGGCVMDWLPHAAVFGYLCCRCSATRSGARWHCPGHSQDMCLACSPAPAGHRAQRRRAEIDESTSRGGRRPPPRWTLFDDVLAQQEELIQRGSMDAREERERREAWVGGASASRPRDAPPMQRAPSAGATGAPDAPGAGAPADAHTLRLERTVHLTLTLTGDFVDELARGYAQDWFQKLVRQRVEECGDRAAFLAELQRISFEVQRPILESWGFEGGAQGLYDMTCILREHLGMSRRGPCEEAPWWLLERIDRCLALLYGGLEGGPAPGGPASA